MNTRDNIQKKVEASFKAVETIEEVKVSLFFKDKTIQRLFSEKEEVPYFWSWFTPKLQLATLVGIVVLNVLAYSQLNIDTYEDTVYDFADTYELSPNEEALLFE